MHVDPDFSRDDVAAQDEPQPHQARLRVVAGARRPRRRRRRSRSSRPRSTGTCTPGTTTARRSTASPCSSSTRPRSQAVDPVTHKVTFTADSGVRRGRRAGGRRRRSPTSTGDGRPEIVIGAQEQYARAAQHRRRRRRRSRCSARPATPATRRLYAISPDGADATHPDRSAAHPTTRPTCRAGRPRSPSSAELLPTIGDGVAMPAAVGDVDADQPRSRDRRRVVGRRRSTCSTPTGAASTARPRPATCPLLWAGRARPARTPHRFGAEPQLRTTLVASIVGFGGPTRRRRCAATARTTSPRRPPGSPGCSTLLAPDLQLPNDDQLIAVGRRHRQPPAGLAAGHRRPRVLRRPGHRRPRRRRRQRDRRRQRRLRCRRRRRRRQRSRPGWPKLTGGWTVGTPGRRRLGRRRPRSRSPSSAATASCSCGTRRARRPRPGASSPATPAAPAPAPEADGADRPRSSARRARTGRIACRSTVAPRTVEGDPRRLQVRRVARAGAVVEGERSGSRSRRPGRRR